MNAAEKHQAKATTTTNIELIRDGDTRYRVVTDKLLTIGWIEVWHMTDEVNRTGIKRFSARPVGASVAKHDCESSSSAVAYIKNYMGI